MGGLTSFASQAFQVLGAVNTVLGAVNHYSNSSGNAAYQAQQQANAIAQQNALNAASIKKQQIALDAQTAETARRDALRRAIAKQKATYGSEGIDSSSGSAQAVLLGKINDAAEAQQQSDALDTLKNAAIDGDLAAQQRLNTLQLTQLKEKNKYNQYTSAYDLGQTVGDLLS